MKYCGCMIVVLLGIASVLPLFAQPTIAVPPAPPVDVKRAWGPEQATGAPDTPQAGDFSTAWAALQPDGGPEWLQVEYAHPVEIKEVRIRESYNPGAVTRVSAFGDDGKELTLWVGDDTTKKAPADFVATPVVRCTTKRVKIYLDTRRVLGWNEIDAVELVGMDETRQWAVKATASSTYAERPLVENPMIDIIDHPGDEFRAFINRSIICHLPGDKNLEGVLLRTGPQFLVLRNEAAHITYIVNKAQVIFAEVKQDLPVED